MDLPTTDDDGAVRLLTRELSVASEALADAYLPLHLQPLESGDAVDFRLVAMSLGRVTVGSVGFGRPMRITTMKPVDNYHVNVLVSGRTERDLGTPLEMHTGRGTARVFRPGDEADEKWAGDTREACLMMDTATVHRELSAMLDTEVDRTIEFDENLDLGPSGSGTWQHVLRLLDHELRTPTGLLSHPLSRQTVEQLVIDTLLIGQPHNYSDLLEARTGAAGPSGISRLVELIRVRPEHSWSTSELAAEAGCSARALQSGFRAVTGRSPIAFLRTVRLHHVRRDLTDHDPVKMSVRTIARRWGFTHLGRFAAMYEREFGELPSETLRQGRSPMKTT